MVEKLCRKRSAVLDMVAEELNHGQLSKRAAETGPRQHTRVWLALSSVWKGEGAWMPCLQPGRVGQ